MILVYFADRVWFYFWHLSWRPDFMLHHHRSRDFFKENREFLALFLRCLVLHVWEPCLALLLSSHECILASKKCLLAVVTR